MNGPDLLICPTCDKILKQIVDGHWQLTNTESSLVRNSSLGNDGHI